MINPCKTVFTLDEDDHKYLVCIDCSNHDEDWAYPLDVGFTAETGETVFKCQVYGFDDADELQDDELLFSIDNIDAAYYDAILLARKIYRDGKLTAVQIKNKPIIILPYSYSTENNPEFAKCIATAISTGKERTPGSSPYTAVALNLTPSPFYIDNCFDDTVAKEVDKNLGIYHKNALNTGFVEPESDPTEYSVSRYVIYWPDRQISDKQIKEQEAPKSLKRDHYPYKMIIYYSSKTHECRYFYDENSEIDCYHRLRLTMQDLKLLNKIGKLEKKSSLPGTTYSLAEKYTTEACDLWEKFYEQFYNPFNLDVEYEPPEGTRRHIIRFTFYDYDYCYYLRKVSKGWEICCTEGWRGSNETVVGMDTV